MALALALPDSYYDRHKSTLEGKRNLLAAGLRPAGFEVFNPEGTYFVTADITPRGGEDGVQFCLSLPERCGVVAAPTQVFYDNPEPGRRLIRFAFCKRDEVLQEGVRRLTAPGR